MLPAPVRWRRTLRSKRLGAPYEAVLVDFRSQGQRSPEYLAVNPKGRVPALVTENGTLTETPALLCFVAQCFPNAELAPLADPFALAQVQEFNSYLCSTVHVAHAHRMRGSRWADDAAAIEAMKRKVPSNVSECFALIENRLAKGPWVMGGRYTICDPYLFTIASWIEGDGVDTAKLPRIMEHRAHMLARPAVQRAVAAEGTQIGMTASPRTTAVVPPITSTNAAAPAIMITRRRENGCAMTTSEEETAMSDVTDQRPPVAVGHVRLNVVDVGAAARWLETVGLRPIVTMDELAVLELRGGTHVVVRRAEPPLSPGPARPST